MSSDWKTRAACTHDPILFFDKQQEERAKRICSQCPVTAECFELVNTFEGRGHSPVPGIWAGMTADERIDERKRLRAQRYRERKRVNRKDVA